MSPAALTVLRFVKSHHMQADVPGDTGDHLAVIFDSVGLKLEDFTAAVNELIVGHYLLRSDFELGVKIKKRARVKFDG